MKEGRRKLYTEVVQNLYSSPNIVMMAKSNKTRCVRPAATYGAKYTSNFARKTKRQEATERLTHLVSCRCHSLK
jgi:hypothetical protein